MTAPAVTVRFAGSDDDTPPDVVAGQTVLFISTTDLPANTLTGYDADNYPASPAVYYYVQAELAGQDDLRSQVAGPDDGHIEWNDLILPAAGTWDIKVYDVADDSEVVSTTVTAV